MSKERPSTAHPVRSRGAMFGLLAGIAVATVTALVAVVQCTRRLIALFHSNTATGDLHGHSTPPSVPTPLGSPTSDASLSIFTSTAADPLALTFLTLGHLLILCAVLVPAVMVASSCARARRERLSPLTFPKLVTRSGMVVLVLGGAGAVVLASFVGDGTVADTSGVGNENLAWPAAFWGVSPVPFLIGTGAIAFGLIARMTQKRENDFPLSY
ncbi:hypothetical protein [Leucobacter sp. 1207-22]|uniref:hypothetical protein n=1 Tax=Leucobacter sp. 1207-22 TaxID=2604456 RepID=UPI0040633594